MEKMWIVAADGTAVNPERIDAIEALSVAPGFVIVITDAHGKRRDLTPSIDREAADKCVAMLLDLVSPQGVLDLRPLGRVLAQETETRRFAAATGGSGARPFRHHRR